MRVHGTAPDGLLTALASYERALMDDDLAAMDALFAPGETTLRSDAGGVLVGREQIAAFRRIRGGAPARTVIDVHVHPVGDDAALVVTVFAATKGGHGQQTQLWRRRPDGPWQVEAAHVSSPPTTFDPTVWRVVGDPLVPASGTGVLDGETVAVKDLYAVAGFAVGAGVPAFLAESETALVHATALARLLDAGAAVRGIARTDQLAYAISGSNDPYGAPPNPAVPGALAGGSSSGSAVAVSLGAASIGLATDTAGSVRVPASYQGLWGVRTTHGSVSTEGLLPLAPDFDAVGVLTRTPALAARTVAVLRGPSRRPEVSADGPLVVAPALLERREPQVRDAFDRWRGGLSEPPDEVALPDLDALYEAFRVHQAAQAWAAWGAWLATHPDALQGAVADRFATAASVTADQDHRATAALATYREQLDDVLADRVLALPSASSAAPALWAGAGEVDRVRAATLAIGSIAGVTGRPAVSAPALQVTGHTGTPAPVGVCFVGPRDSDVALVERADAVTC